MRLSEHSEPEPDIVLLRWRDDEYLDVLPEVPDVLLIVEVADSSLAYDRRVKMGLYTRAGIPESWLLALPEDRLYVYRDPSADGYRTVHTFGRTGSIAPLAFPDVELPVEQLL